LHNAQRLREGCREASTDEAALSAEVLPSPDPDPPDEASTPPNTVRAPTGDIKELRLGLVCYGGVSLAIYMHGVTKEIHRAVRASVLEEHDLPSDAEAHSEGAYRRLLKALSDERDVHTRIVVDAIAGTSAGGINGIFLAKALAHDLNQDSLRDMWFTHGDLERIIREPRGVRAWLEERLADLLPLGGGDDDVPRREAREKLLVAALRVYADPLLEGDEMTRRLYEALAGMERDEQSPAPESRSLLPRRHLLELFVTVTDYSGYARELPIVDPQVVAERQHRHVLRFCYRSDQTNDFSARENGALTLAARATSSLPLVFEPVHVGTFADVLPAGATTPEDVERFFRAYSLAGATPGWAHLVDGGVLDNKPFGPVLRAIAQRPAANEVDRYLIYLEPDPKPTDTPDKEPPAPKPIPALLGALSGLPRSEPILNELHDLLERNEHVRAVRDTIEANWAPIEIRMLELVGDLDDAPAPDDARLSAWSNQIHDMARSSAELAYPMYVRLKISSAIDAFAGAACLVCHYTDASNQAFLVRALVRGWARRRQLFQHEKAPTAGQLQFVRDFDLDYAQRRLQFVIAGVSWLYRDLEKDGAPTRQQLDAVKERLYQAVARLETLSSGRGFAREVLGGVRACFGEERLREYLELHRFDTRAFLDEHGDELDDLNDALGTFLTDELRTFTPDLYGDLLALTSTWTMSEATEKIRRDLLIRYLGFPIWDALLYPLQAYTDVGERDAVRVARLSPVDSRLLRPVDGRTKVLGARLGHAYAFFSRKARENDYLWGRLDAAESLVRLLLTRTTPEDEVVLGTAHPEYRSRCKAAFHAILDEEAAYLPSIGGDVNALRKQLEAP
jgi:patatin-related protein